MFLLQTAMNTDLVFDGITLLLCQSNDPVDDFLWDKTKSKGKYNQLAGDLMSNQFNRYSC